MICFLITWIMKKYCRTKFAHHTVYVDFVEIWLKRFRAKRVASILWAMVIQFREVGL